MGQIVLLLVMGLLNFVLTLIAVDSFLFKGARERITELGRRLATNRRRAVRLAGGKLEYLPTCALCVGVWLGLLSAMVPLGPVGSGASVSVPWVLAVIIDGLAYKGLGHLLYQLNALAHNRNELLRAKQECIQKALDRLGDANGRGPDLATLAVLEQV